MSGLTAALRFVHYAAAIALAGEFAFLLWVALPLRPADRGEWAVRCRRVAARWLALVLASGVVWFFVQAQVMSGGAYDRGTLAAALTGTLFGRVASARLALSLALAAALALLPRARYDTLLLAVCGTLAAALLTALAATGHGAAEQGTDRAVHLPADALHLLAAGAWLGALPALAFTLRRGADIPFAAGAVRRFSALGIVSVATLIVTGSVNAWYTVGDVPGLLGTRYGILLCAKLALFSVMVAFAAANRLRWTPAAEFSRLHRNALAEAALGLCVLALVAVLGITVPALHAKIVWPFPYTLEWSALARPRVVPAHPTTYFESPVPYSAPSVLRGERLYAEDCAGCHGPYGNGDGPLADSLPRRPPNLATRLATAREGDLLWAIANGVPGTAMPAFARLSEDQIWDLLNFVRAQANVDAGRRLDASVERWRPVTAPDFTFQIGRGGQESLAGQRGRTIVLLVFYSLPQSLPRLRELAEAKPSRFARMGVRVVAVPLAGTPPRDAKGMDASMLAVPDPGLVAAYAMFTRTIAGPRTAPLRHVEFLIDRQGTLRARVIEPARQPVWTLSELLRQTVLLNKELSRAPAPRRHAH